MRRGLTELEGTVLGLVGTRQPCTPYQIRREFADSPSPYWSGSAGAIYPLMARLATAGLVRSEAHATGARKSRHYRLTALGRRALRRWLGPPVGELTAGVPPDPLRTRIPFLAMLPAKTQATFLEDVEARMREHLKAAQADLALRAGDGPYFELMGRGAIEILQARLKWVRSTSVILGKLSMRRGATERTPR